MRKNDIWGPHWGSKWHRGLLHWRQKPGLLVSRMVHRHRLLPQRPPSTPQGIVFNVFCWFQVPSRSYFWWFTVISKGWAAESRPYPSNREALTIFWWVAEASPLPCFPRFDRLCWWAAEGRPCPIRHDGVLTFEINSINRPPQLGAWIFRWPAFGGPRNNR